MYVIRSNSSSPKFITEAIWIDKEWRVIWEDEPINVRVFYDAKSYHEIKVKYPQIDRVNIS